MTIITTMLRATTEFVILNIIAIPLINDPISMGWYAVSIVLAFALRLGIEYNSNTLTAKSAFIQTIYTITFCWFAIIFWFTYLNYEKGLEVYLFTCSLFAVFMVAELKKIFEIGFPATLRIWLKNFLAKEDKEVKP